MQSHHALDDMTTTGSEPHLMDAIEEESAPHLVGDAPHQDALGKFYFYGKVTWPACCLLLGMFPLSMT